MFTFGFFFITILKHSTSVMVAAYWHTQYSFCEITFSCNNCQSHPVCAQHILSDALLTFLERSSTLFYDAGSNGDQCRIESVTPKPLSYRQLEALTSIRSKSSHWQGGIKAQTHSEHTHTDTKKQQQNNKNKRVLWERCGCGCGDSRWPACCRTCWRAASACAGRACGSCRRRRRGGSCPACSWTRRRATAAQRRRSGCRSRRSLDTRAGRGRQTVKRTNRSGVVFVCFFFLLDDISGNTAIPRAALTRFVPI